LDIVDLQSIGIVGIQLLQKAAGAFCLRRLSDRAYRFDFVAGMFHAAAPVVWTSVVAAAAAGRASRSFLAADSMSDTLPQPVCLPAVSTSRWSAEEISSGRWVVKTTVAFAAFIERITCTRQRSPASSRLAFGSSIT